MSGVGGTEPEKKPEGPKDEEKDTDGISAFAARVLGQLSLSSWLPSAFLVASLAVLLEFRRRNSIGLLGALDSLTRDPVRLAVVMVPTLVVATMITQAFSFNAITLLRGEWPNRWPATTLGRLLTGWQLSRRQRIAKQLDAAYQGAFPVARYRMLRSGVPLLLVDAVEARFFHFQPPPMLPEEEADAKELKWHNECDPWQLARIDGLLEAGRRYPCTSRMLPTGLGNVIRATTDTLGDDVQSLVLRRLHLVSPQVRSQHELFRNRLDLYCTLVLICAVLAVLAPIVLCGRVGAVRIAPVFMLFVVLGGISYYAALASARGYCSALRQMSPPKSE